MIEATRQQNTHLQYRSQDITLKVSEQELSQLLGVMQCSAHAKAGAEVIRRLPAGLCVGRQAFQALCDAKSACGPGPCWGVCGIPA